MKYHICNRLYENTATGKRSEILAEVLVGLKAVTLARDFICPVPKTNGFWKTDPFLEARTVNPETLERLRGVDPRPGNLDDLIDAVCAAIAAIWDINKVHVVFHSSGHDSRILSSCIRKLYHDGRISGDVLFLTNRWEAKAFTKIMRLQGWKPGQYAVYAEGPASEHFGRALDFERYWYTNNAPIAQLGNALSNMAEFAQSAGLLPADEHLQFFNGHGPEIGVDREGAWTLHGSAEMTAQAIWANTSHYYYWSQWVNCPANTHTNFVLAEQGVINAALGCDIHGSRRQAIADRLCPEIRAVPRMGISDNNHPVSDRIRRKAEQDYLGSYYAKLTKTTWTAPTQSASDARWAVWGLASLVEHLHQQGVEIRKHDQAA